MEKEMMDKIDKIRDDLREKIVLHNERYNEFCKEFFTDDIIKIVNDFLNNGIDITMNLNDKYKLCIKPGFVTICDKEMKSHYLNIDKYCGEKYDNDSLRKLKIKAEYFNQSEKMLNAFIDNADSVIKFISDKYTDINNKRADLINEIIGLLDVDEPKARHIKITVEWS